jgi:hypothetical protein
MTAAIFHQRARDCFRLAAECPDLYAREALQELADEFERMAQLLDERARRSPKPALSRSSREHDQPRPRQAAN